MARKTFAGFGITELRTYATEYRIAGRSKMTGEELLAACRTVWTTRRLASEAVVLPAVHVGALLRFRSHPDCVIRVTSGIVRESGGSENGWTDPGPLFVRAEYVSMCHRCDPVNRDGSPVTAQWRLDFHNRNGAALRFFLHSLQAMPSSEDDDRDPLTIDPAGPQPDQEISAEAAAAFDAVTARVDAVTAHLAALPCCGRPHSEHPRTDPTTRGTCTVHPGVEVAMHWDGRRYVCGQCATDAFHAPPSVEDDADPACDDDPAGLPTGPANYTVEVVDPADGSTRIADSGSTHFVAGTTAGSIARQATVAAAAFRTRERIPGRVRVTIQVPDGPGATGEAGPPATDPTGRDALNVVERITLDTAYADGQLDSVDGHAPAETLVAAGWLVRGMARDGGRRTYYPAGRHEIAYAVETRSPAGRWAEVGSGRRRTPVVCDDVLEAVATAIADACAVPGEVRVSVSAGPGVYAVAYRRADAPDVVYAA